MTQKIIPLEKFDVAFQLSDDNKIEIFFFVTDEDHLPRDIEIFQLTDKGVHSEDTSYQAEDIMKFVKSRDNEVFENACFILVNAAGDMIKQVEVKLDTGMALQNRHTI